MLNDIPGRRELIHVAIAAILAIVFGVTVTVGGPRCFVQALLTGCRGLFKLFWLLAFGSRPTDIFPWYCVPLLTMYSVAIVAISAIVCGLTNYLCGRKMLF